MDRQIRVCKCVSSIPYSIEEPRDREDVHGAGQHNSEERPCNEAWLEAVALHNTLQLSNQ